MGSLLRKADASGDGTVSLDEFQTLLEDPTMRLWLSAQDIDVGDTALLFDLLDNGDGELTADDLCCGISRLKGPARSFDMYGVMHMITHLGSAVKRIEAKLEHGIEKDYKIRDA